ncbi:hypothetical protein KUL17_18720 [Alteromonas sp. KUL17]|uniref:hypothetical protein n=1 Tax=Alteromonas sp. KUL17 TaxID=2480796 RepID=UPI001037E7B1|nr:hypothetical protein [Alteromonas sp. KUL17]TAP26672.1 hypothetical protein KUL49_09290 [Alteromonas sp. KUL17]GEA02975.1 hypothetical protein KUL17_18720 [Alteromonas sp. KUL17]
MIKGRTKQALIITEKRESRVRKLIVSKDVKKPTSAADATVIKEYVLNHWMFFLRTEISFSLA